MNMVLIQMKQQWKVWSWYKWNSSDYYEPDISEMNTSEWIWCWYKWNGYEKCDPDTSETFLNSTIPIEVNQFWVGWSWRKWNSYICEPDTSKTFLNSMIPDKSGSVLSRTILTQMKQLFMWTSETVLNSTILIEVNQFWAGWTRLKWNSSVREPDTSETVPHHMNPDVRETNINLSHPPNTLDQN